MVRHTLEQMQLGGMYDLVEGGFCRYSTDEKWLVPHFEKMTYDNGLLIELYATASQQLDDDRFLVTAKESADFMLERMAEESLFYSASDADTEGVEGKYFVYGYKEVTALLAKNSYSQEEIGTITKTLSLTPEGNFEGHNIIRLTQDKRPEWFAEVMALLRSLRQERVYPFIDKKVQVSWNAMMISALFTLGDIDGSYRQAAVRHLGRLLETMMIEGRLYHSALMHKEPKVEAFLEDYAYLGRALVKGYESTFDEYYLILAQQLANTALTNYYEEGRWYFSKGEFVTEADIGDSSYPGSIGVIVDLLFSLGALVDPKYRHFGFKTLEYYSQKLSKTPIYFPYLLDQMFRYLKGERIIKAKADLLKGSAALLSKVNYPYTKRYASAESEGFLICGLESCFANSEDAARINELIKRTL
jgi:uncharacterized protein YyaL (SSP411 family)